MERVLADQKQADYSRHLRYRGISIISKQNAKSPCEGDNEVAGTNTTSLRVYFPGGCGRVFEKCQNTCPIVDEFLYIFMLAV